MRHRGAAGIVGPLLAALLAVVLAGCGPAAGSTGQGSAGSSSGGTATALAPCPAQPDRPAAGARTMPKLSFRCPGGGTFDLAKAPGVPTVVNLWGSWCPPCRAEMPLLQQAAQAAGNRLRVIGVISKDGLPQAGSFAADAGVTFPSAFDGDGRLMAALGINMLPYTYFLDADGAVTYVQVGPVGSLDQLKQLVAEHLGVQL